MTSTNKPLFVTQPFMPPLEEFLPYLERIWENKMLTNNGPIHQELEQALCDHLGVPHLSLFANGTLALMVALQALRITGEVITTPYSFVATTHALHWNGIQPVFADIDEGSFNLDPARIEAAITPRTTAIVPVHVYGNPCDVEGIQQVADTFGLKVIYDAAPAFGVRVNGRSVLNYGDLSVLSFHATKIFNTFEGGAIVCQDEKMKRRIDFLKNFGFADEVTVVAPGINAKMNEMQSAFGLLQLKYLDQMIERRAEIDAVYREGLKEIPGLKLFAPSPEVSWNHSSFPVLVEHAFPLKRDEMYQRLRAEGIHVRRYFYPLISEFPAYRGLPSARRDNLPVASRISSQVLCLPIYPALTADDLQRVLRLVRELARGN
ncbi:DegT/DnrJ/EryC1/StrS family aminotransferase [Geomonas sp. Red276]